MFSSILIAGCTKRQSVEGKILDRVTKLPIPNVSLAKGSKTAVFAHADSTGHFEYSDIPGYDTVTLFISKSGYKPARLFFRGITKGEIILKAF